MANLMKSLFRAGRMARKGRPLSAAFALGDAMASSASSLRQATRKPATKRPSARHGAASPPRRPAPGSFITDEFRCRQGALRYWLYTPTGSARRRMPLVVMLHGCSQTAPDFASGTGMNALADELGFLVLYPQQSQSANLARCWNWHSPDNQARGKGEPAIIAALTRHAMALGRVNPARVYIAGLSAGGAAAAIIGTAYPDLFVAVGVHSGVATGSIRSMTGALSAMRGGTRPEGARPEKARPQTGKGRTRRPRPMIIFHGDQDRVVHPSNAGAFLHNMEKSYPGPLVSESFSGKADKSGKGRDFTRKIHRTKNGETLLEEWTVHGSGHGWSGGRLAGSYTDPEGPDASREMLRFFLSHKRGS